MHVEIVADVTVLRASDFSHQFALVEVVVIGDTFVFAARRMASRAAIVIVSGSDGRRVGRNAFAAS